MKSTFIDENALRPNGEDSEEFAFSELYNQYFRVLFNYAYSKVNDQFIAQEIVQELFISIWKQRHTNPIQSNQAYLFASIKNLIISYYRKEYTRQYHYSQWEIHSENATESTDQSLLTADLQQHYEAGLQLLPPKCREVFLSSRKGHSNREIAQQLAISEKTVEQHITKARGLLKNYLKGHLAYTLLSVFSFFE